MALRVFVYEPLISKDEKTAESYEWLQEKGLEVDLGNPMLENPPRSFSEDELIARARDADGIMGAGRDYITRRVMEECKNLKVISKYAVGVSNIDVKAATELGILVTNTPMPENHEAVAEHTICLMLAVLKQLYFYTPEYMQKGMWRGPFNEFLRGKKVLLIGLGRIGKAVSRRLNGWGVTLLGYDPGVRQDEVASLGVEMKSSLLEGLEAADIVSIHCLLTEETRHMLGERELNHLRPGATVINTARGPLIDEKALYRLLKNGHISRAGLDVFEEEPSRGDNPLFTLPNVIVTPHISGWTVETLKGMEWAGAKNLYEALTGTCPKNAVNPEVYPRVLARLAR